MEKYTNEIGKECFKGVELNSPFNSELFHEVADMPEGDVQFALHTNLGSLTVLDRMTGYGYGIRDTETGFRDNDGNFWLASSSVDVRRSRAKT
ncbi:MAG: hypothetical protein KAS32_21420, partial [Candidatus Peribacteraceae bacterium]|nr:hypothetical protein [Candidatus Peribacteraceae bacterium]